jgi:hypothetical protein
MSNKKGIACVARVSRTPNSPIMSKCGCHEYSRTIKKNETINANSFKVGFNYVNDSGTVTSKYFSGDNTQILDDIKYTYSAKKNGNNITGYTINKIMRGNNQVNTSNIYSSCSHLGSIDDVYDVNVCKQKCNFNNPR